MIQKQFAQNVVTTIAQDENVIGLAAAGSWITNELDEYSDLDLILITQKPVAGDKEKMLQYADRFGALISAFTGEHVGEPRVLICLYDNPLLHVDIKFLMLPEFYQRIENPVILFEREEQLSRVINSSNATWPPLNFQWTEDRFWTWVHYACLKIGRGELLEALDFLGYLRMMVLSPLLQLKNNQLPRGLRKVEMNLVKTDLASLTDTIPVYDKKEILRSLTAAVELYRSLRKELYNDMIRLQEKAEEKSIEFLEEIKRTV